MERLDQERRELVNRLRGIIHSAFDPAQVAVPPAMTWQETAHRRRMAATLPIRRANALRDIRLITKRYGWEDEIGQALAEAGVPALKHMETDRLEQLVARLRTLVDCLHTPCDPPDAPPAR